MQNEDLVEVDDGSQSVGDRKDGRVRELQSVGSKVSNLVRSIVSGEVRLTSSRIVCVTRLSVASSMLAVACRCGSKLISTGQGKVDASAAADAPRP